MKPPFFIFHLSFIILLGACTTSARLDSIQNNFASGNYEKLNATPKSDNLELLVGAQAEFSKNEYAQSDELFEAFNARNIDPTRTSIGAELGKLTLGQMAGDYKPYMMDFLFVSYYQLWDAIATHRDNDANVIINQSYERQKKMSREYKKLISDRQKSDTDDKLKTDTSKWTAYGDIMNPALTYLAGLYFLNAGEHENARQYLNRASGMSPNNEYIKKDLSLSENLHTPDHVAWIFIETGFAPRLVERRIDLPWPVGNKLEVISIATSEPKILSPTPPPAGAQLLADTDAMFLAEYNEYQINDALRAVTKAAANIAIQSVAQNQMNGWGGILAIMYSVATTQAEIRSWVTLPQKIYLKRIVKDKSGLINLGAGDNIEIEYNGNHLIYIRNNDIKKIKIK